MRRALFLINIGTLFLFGCTAQPDDSPAASVAEQARLVDEVGTALQEEAQDADSADARTKPLIIGRSSAEQSPLAGVGDDTPPTELDAAVPEPVSSPTPHKRPMPLPTPPSPLIDFYVVQPGDTLGGISWAYDIPIEDLVALNDLDSESAIIQIGQTLHVPLDVSRTGPLVTLLPDGEVVYSPAYLDFDTAAFLQEQGSYLVTFSQTVNGNLLSGAEVIDKAAHQFSVGPRVLLAALEYYGGLVTNDEPQSSSPAGPANPYADNLFIQLSWLANQINEGYYGYKRSGSMAVRFRDTSRAIVPPGMNAGTVGIQNMLAVNSNWEDWQEEVAKDGFMQTYRQLFGDPFEGAFEPVVPFDLTQPEMALPWEVGQTFYYTGGPHAAYGDGSAWAAIDFGPPDVIGSCFYSNVYTTAAADGKLFLGSTGELYLDLDGDGNLQTGWVLLYLHVVALDTLTHGQMVAQGDPLGYASCEGGLSNSSHLHFARRYNGEWIAADGAVPMVLSGWQVKAGLGQYNGDIVRDDEVRTACECWDEPQNGLFRE